MTLLEGRRALVTGGASGIGAAVVQRLTQEGAGGVVLDLPAALASATLPGGWEGVAVDLRDDEATADAFVQAARLAPQLDLLVAAAGVVPGWSTIAELDLAEWDAVLAVNARGLVATLKHASPRIRDDGAVVVIASLNSWRGDANLTTYAASKHAALGVVRSAALDLGRRGIRVNGVAPGPIATDALVTRMTRREAEGGLPVAEALAQAASATALGRIATVDDVAAATLFLASDMAGGVTGHLLPVDGGLS
ncbi:SDR family NAD(P)-dependent oxidoreductase [Conexibacter sp. CPCC 206217]|uniref:SDR family NAD(P)-dependent oxidoreductase n=1 Tax=Conexibacter sp. CPCC 206217 TaxID=3064574 RepID=UPI0027226EAC|nr:SDR family oxidoreductase [Conexibacter sp. CPCC 206217]MDO8209027.1 SDR family oxidoreductase [Conexibacter sp. CPCC 206217]